MNPWVELVQSTPEIILQIFSEFQRDFMGTTTVSTVNSWEDFYPSTPKAILHIYADLARGLLGCTRVTRVKLKGRIFLNHLQSYYAYPLSSQEILVEKKEL